MWTFGLLWLIGNLLLLTAMTDLFTENPFNKSMKPDIILIFMFGYSTLTIINLFRRYFKQKSAQN
ncbi:hypothetical protein FCR2A7T_28430 [Flavobacterium cauense R2A-7]|nr:hypothetical protein FCR2A7T_28430 [Flavobacterium cauense R2A-7]